MSLLFLSIKCFVLVFVLFIVIVFFGFIGLIYLGVCEYLSVDLFIIIVIINYVGANVDIIEF